MGGNLYYFSWFMFELYFGQFSWFYWMGQFEEWQGTGIRERGDEMQRTATGQT